MTAWSEWWPAGSLAQLNSTQLIQRRRKQESTEVK